MSNAANLAASVGAGMVAGIILATGAIKLGAWLGRRSARKFSTRNRESGKGGE